MKMMRFYTVLIVFAFLTSCKEEAHPGKANDQFYYLEFVDQDSTAISKGTIAAIKQRLIGGGGYYYGANPHGGEWIRGIGYTDSADVAMMDEHFLQVHRFRDISEYKTSDVNAEKIVITIHSPNKDKLNNFDFHSYKKLGREEWQPVFNPGNFQFSHPNPEGQEKDLGVWMSELIVRLTFK
jgi:hypothetical protein